MRINRWRKFWVALMLMPAWLPLLIVKRVVGLVEDVLGILFGDTWFWFEKD